MTVLSRGARARRGGRRPGWLLLTALLVTAIAASTALVFTTRVELLKLAVVLALWAAVVAAFASMIYRRQSDVDQARARDLKLVYDLQLDREISARREYELTVESQLRRELASELRSQAADEVAALRTELTALRTNLEILFDADLDHQPALETERTTVRAYSDWGRDVDAGSAGQVSSSRIADLSSETAANETDQNPIIDVPEVGVGPNEWDAPTSGTEDGSGRYRSAGGQGAPNGYAWTGHGSHRQWHNNDGWSRAGADWQSGGRRRRSEPVEPEPESQATAFSAAPSDEAAATGPDSQWQPVGAEGQWIPPGAPGSNWASSEELEADAAADEVTQLIPTATDDDPAEQRASSTAEPTAGRRRRHAGAPESAPSWFDDVDPSGWPAGADRRAGARHYAESETPAADTPPPPDAPPEPPSSSAARHRSPDLTGDAADPTSGGQSVADLLARLQTGPAEGGGRRRREE